MSNDADGQQQLEEQERAYWELYQAYNQVYGCRMTFTEFTGWMDAVHQQEVAAHE